MIPIYLCDDQISFLNEITKIVEKITVINEFNFYIKSFTQNPNIMLESLKFSPKQGIYFLDVDLGNNIMNGFELGEKIREIDPRGFIIYVTTHDELLLETFKYRLEALDYIIKDDVNNMWESLEGCLKAINQRLLQDPRDNRDYFAVQKGSYTNYIPFEDIIYFETSTRKHVIALIAKEETIEFYDNLSDIERRLSGNFLRVHRSFLVNINHIKSFDYRGRRLLLNHNKSCDVSRNKIKELKLLLINN